MTATAAGTDVAVERHPSPSLRAARFGLLGAGEAPGKAGGVLGGLVGRHGEVAAIVATMAESPAVLSGYLDARRDAGSWFRGHLGRSVLSMAWFVRLRPV